MLAPVEVYVLRLVAALHVTPEVVVAVANVLAAHDPVLATVLALLLHNGSAMVE